MSINDERRARIAIGLDAEHFVLSKVGRHVLKRADDQRDAALQGLADVNPEDPQKIRELQNTVRCVAWFHEWLAELVQDGYQAFEEAEQDDAHDPGMSDN